MKKIIHILFLAFLVKAGFAIPAIIPEQDSMELDISLTVLDIIDVKDAEETITIEFLFGVSWSMPQFKNQEIPYSEDIVPWIEMQYITEIESFFEKKIMVDERGIARFNRRIIGTLRHPFDFTNFPFDKQKWKMVFFNAGGKSYSLLPDNFYLALHEDFIDPPTWKTSFIGTENIAIRGPGPDIHGLSYNFQIKRNSKYYVWKVLIPIGLIVLMSWGVFWIKPEEISAQLTVSVTAILTLVAFQFNVSQLVPPLSYLTILDKFTIGADILVFLAFLESLITSYQTQIGRYNRSIKIDRISRWVFPTTFTIFILTLFF